MKTEVIAALIIVGGVVAWVMLRRGEALRFETTAAPGEVIHSAISFVGTKRRWAVLSNNETAATFGYHKKPSKLLAFVLLLCFIVPGVVYLALAGKKESLAVSTSARPGSNTAVQVVSNGWRGKGAGRRMRAQLQSAAGTLAQAAPEGGDLGAA
jgi:hypothetical protein